MPKKKSSSEKEEETPKGSISSRRKKLGYRTPKRFKRLVFRRNPALTTQRPRNLGGHR